MNPRTDNFGLALISRHPIIDPQLFELDGRNPAVQGRIRTALGEWTIVGLHPFPPAGRTYSGYRNRQLHSAARRIEPLSAPRVILGDLNSTSSSPMFRDFLEMTGLKDSRIGFGWQPTWPAGSLSFRIPIDHVLVESDLVVQDRQVGPDIGSDHLPVRVRLKRRL
jgi:endonuclease/exonuclease/phosphatase (EEP) superfamily protein YafD